VWERAGAENGQIMQVPLPRFTNMPLARLDAPFDHSDRQVG
jgi:hypothetical protein